MRKVGDKMNTTVDDIKDKFYSLIITGEVLPESLVNVWLDTAIGEYNLELGTSLEITKTVIPSEEIDIIIAEINDNLSSSQKSLLGRYMQREFITRELSRYSKVTGIDSKDEKVSGLQATKITLRAELTLAETAIAELVSKIKEIDYGK